MNTHIYQGIDYTDILNNFNCNYDESFHSMGKSLKNYINIKLPDFLFNDFIEEIYVVGNYDRNAIISDKEKTDKVFNYERPTYKFENKQAFVYCYPGIDYVYHYSKMIKYYLEILNLNKKLITIYPSEGEIRNTIENSNLKCIPNASTVIMGYVNGLEYLSNNKNWIGTQDFMWKSINDKKILLGCKHSYWGDISYYVVELLASLGVKNIIYSEKLGTLNEEYLPNQMLATGNKSIFKDGSIINWDNLFDNAINSENIKYGVHATMPSILDETKEWVNQNKYSVDFVDPEIGFMAKAALDNNINFSYLHIISDNLSRKFDEDLSNERKESVILKRKRLIKQIGDNIIRI